MFLSMIELNPRCSQVRAELKDPYQLHRTISRAFGDGEGEYRQARCLFRVDESCETRMPQALVQSRICPAWDKLIVPPYYMNASPKVKEFNPRFDIGQLIHFRLRANPTIKCNGKRQGLHTEEKQYKWIVNKGENCGFTVLDLAIKPEDLIKSLTASGKSVTLLSAMYEGTLIVKSADLFLETVESGIGSAKGFGFGMLSIASQK